MEDKKNILNMILVLAFCIVLYSPFIASIIFKESKAENKENRELAKIPELAFSKEFAKNFEAYYNDHFVFRDKIIAKHSLNKIIIFKSSPFPDKVLFGKDKFLFLNTEEVHKSYSHRDLLSEEELKKVTKAFKQRSDSLSENGIQYYFGAFPNKHSIYENLMPATMKRQIIGENSLTDQLKESFEKNGLSFFDSRQEMSLVKDSISLYLKLDSHWNNQASFISYQTFFNKHGELGVVPLSIKDFKRRYSERAWGDLSNLLAVDSIRGYTEQRPLFELMNKSYAFKRVDVDDLPPRAIRTINENSSSKKAKVLFFGDSYSDYVVNYFSLHFEEVIYLRDTYNPDMVNMLKPDVVIDISVERFIYKHF